jgi:hypothetical protein
LASDYNFVALQTAEQRSGIFSWPCNVLSMDPRNTQHPCVPVRACRNARTGGFDLRLIARLDARGGEWRPGWDRRP